MIAAMTNAATVVIALREMHRAVDAHGTGRIVCGTCWNAMGEYHHWPCPTDRMIYRQDEL